MGHLILRAIWKPVALLLTLLGIYAKGRADSTAQAKAADAAAYVDTRRRMDDADILGDDPAAARRWLHERRQSGGDL